MPILKTADASIYYEVHGDGRPLLLLPPGGMDASISFWGRTAFDPLKVLAGDFTLIALDERNSGQSAGDLAAGDPWDVYARDHLALLDHLGLDRVHVLGCCIGSSHALRLARVAPQRVVSMVLEQPVGRSLDNQELLAHSWAPWAARMAANPPGHDARQVEDFARRMWQGDFVLSVSRDDVHRCATPMLVLPGVDPYHPTAIGDEIVSLAPHATVLHGWKSSPESTAQAVAAIREFIRRQVAG
ncbi:MAG: alpha/beta hydrolase [Burkholderiaceae bacterium]|nr:alpha/beta hydrolase [Burkholderiaceae bacterium]MDO9089817.1 alpha/beta hydrolase [Burkholderiaceae bacterium]